VIDGQSYDVSYKHSIAGALLEETFPSGRVVRNHIGVDGGIVSVSSKSANTPFRNFASNFNFTAAGAVKSMMLGNGRWETGEFNSRRQLTQIGLGSSSTDTGLWKLTYHYGELNPDGRTVDAAKNTGNIAMQTVSFAGLTEPFVQTYRYDSLYRITEARETNGPATNASQNWKETFGYDRYGNRTNYAKFTGTTQLALDNKTFPSIDPATNRLIRIRGSNMTKTVI